MITVQSIFNKKTMVILLSSVLKVKKAQIKTLILEMRLIKRLHHLKIKKSEGIINRKITLNKL
jgi:hypothetical protein